MQSCMRAHIGVGHRLNPHPVFCSAEVGMTQPCMRAYTQLVIKTCHKRGVHAMGGMAAQIPIKNDPAANTVRGASPCLGCAFHGQVVGGGTASC